MKQRLLCIPFLFSLLCFAQDVDLHVIQSKHTTVNTTQATNVVNISGTCEPQTADITQPVMQSWSSGNGAVRMCDQSVSTAASAPNDSLWAEATMTDAIGSYRVILTCWQSAGQCPKLKPGKNYKAQRKSDTLLLATGGKRPSKLLIRKAEPLKP